MCSCCHCHCNYSCHFTHTGLQLTTSTAPALTRSTRQNVNPFSGKNAHDSLVNGWSSNTSRRSVAMIIIIISMRNRTKRLSNQVSYLGVMPSISGQIGVNVGCTMMVYRIKWDL
jgi:hypothetical protein